MLGTPTSRSTTPDSQITVRSSPLSNKIDTISVCRDCIKRCKSKLSSSSSNSLLVHSHKEQNSRSSLISTPSSTCSTITDENKNVSKDPNVIKPKATKNNKVSKNKAKDLCSCKCTPKDFEGTTIAADVLKQERVKILNDISEIQTSSMKNLSEENVGSQSNRSSAEITSLDDENWPLMSVSLSESLNTDKFDPFDIVPTISIVPPTPEGIHKRLRYGYKEKLFQSNEKFEFFLFPFK